MDPVLRWVVCAAALSAAVGAGSRTAVADGGPAAPLGRAAVRATATGRGATADSVVLRGRRVWTGRPGERVVSRIAPSARGDALAFAVRGPGGAVALCVVLVGEGAPPHVMRFPVPERARPRRGHAVTWLGSRRVAYGPSELQPAVVASWRLR